MITIDGGTGIIKHNGIEIASDKMHDQWVVENDTSADSFTNNIITSWTRSTMSDAAPYLTGMSHSSGVFTFPKTGIYRIDFKLEPKDLMMMDNHRLLHGRTEFDPNSGHRHLQGYYMDRDEIIGRLSYLKSNL